MANLALYSVLVVEYPDTFNHAFHLGLHGERVISLEARTNGEHRTLALFVRILDALTERLGVQEKQKSGLRRSDS